MKRVLLSAALMLACLRQIPLEAANPGAQPQKPPTLKTANELLRIVRAELPKGWSASYDKEYSWLEISRDEAVSTILGIINGPPGQKPERRKFLFAFRIVSGITVSEYRRLSAENVRVHEEANELFEQLVKMRIRRKFDSFLGRTDEEKKAVARYEGLKSSLHSLPSYYFRDNQPPVGDRLA
jgi:hypothetical protein